MVKLRTMSVLLIACAVMGLGITKFIQANADNLPSSPEATALPSAPEFSATTAAGEVFTLSEVGSDKTVILEWSNHDCPFVMKHYATPPANMQGLQTRSTDENTVWVTIVSSAPGKQGHISPEQAAELTTSRGAAPDHIILDETGEIGRLYKAKTTPHMFIIDDGKIVYQGAIDSVRSARVRDIKKADNYVASALDALASGETPNPANTKPYGCSVKYGKKK